MNHADTPAARMQLFPVTARIEARDGASVLTVAGLDLEALAQEYGTPLYVFDRATLDQSVSEYRQALGQYYPGETGITYAGKAFLCTAIAGWAQRHGLWIDCTGRGEIHVAASAGVSPEQILVHGVNKSMDDLQAAVAHAGVVVVDNLTELERLAGLFLSRPTRFPDLWLRLRPGLPVDTHSYTQTGQSDSKFGMDFSEAVQAVHTCRQHGMPLTGLHFHQGSHFHEPAPVGIAIQSALDFIEETRTSLDWIPQVLCPGGGWGVAYHPADLPHPPISDYVRFVSESVAAGCRSRGLPLPRLQLEPGRSLVARAGVSLYTLGAVKHTAGRRWLLIDGGMADNPRPALYGARYSALPVRDPQRPASGPVWLGGPFCESGDVLIEDLPMPAMQPGEIIAVPVSGAYHLSMGSNYNGACKPAVLWLDAGKAHMILKRQTPDDLLARDCPLP